MNISFDNLNKVKRAFEAQLDKTNILMDLDFPFFNTYVWQGKKGSEEILFSSPYKTQRYAEEHADQSHFDPVVANATENNIKWLGVFDGSRVIIRK